MRSLDASDSKRAPFYPGNEFSYFMLMVSNFVLNGIREVRRLVPIVSPRKQDDAEQILN